MVLAPTQAAFEADGGMLALLRARRAEADATLLQSVRYSSLSMLTIAVAFVIALRGSPGRLIVVPLAPPEPPKHETKRYAPGGEIAPPIADPSKVPDYRVVDEDLQQDTPLLTDSIGPGETAGPPDASGQTGEAGTQSGAVTADPGPYEFVPHDDEPVSVTRVTPEYPGLARDAGMEGTVLVRLLVGIDGRVKRAEIETSSALFDDAALGATRQWIFTPARSNGHPVVVWVRVPVRFQLH